MYINDSIIIEGILLIIFLIYSFGNIIIFKVINIIISQVSNFSKLKLFVINRIMKIIHEIPVYIK